MKYVREEDLFMIARELLRKGLRVCIPIIIEKIGSGPRSPGAKMVVAENGEAYGTLGGGPFERMVIEDALEALRKGRPLVKKYTFTGKTVDKERGDVRETGLLCGGTVTVFFDVIKPRPRAYIVGAGRIGEPLASILAMLGIETVVMDVDEEVLKRVSFSKTQTKHGNPGEIGDYIAMTARPIDMVFIVHGETRVDVPVLQKALESKAGFISILGSKRKIMEYLKIVLKEGANPDNLRSRVRAPAGIDIGASTPEEIAVSIAAQAIAWINGSEKNSYNQLSIVDQALQRIEEARKR